MEAIVMAKAHLRLAAPGTENRTFAPARSSNAKLRTREYLTESQVEKLIDAARDSRHGERDALMILLAYRHGLRAAELVDMRWEQVDFRTGSLHVRRTKNGASSTHPLTARELRALRQHQPGATSPFIFITERSAPLSAPGFARIVERAAAKAKLGIGGHVHMLRHGCRVKLANDGVDTRSLQAYLGSTMRNTTGHALLAPDRLRRFWRD
jgi:integrase